MHKRGQIVGMPIVYISVIIMMALVLYFGFGSLTKIIHAKDITQVSTFVLDLERDIDVVYHYDSGSAISFQSNALPKKVTHVCFFNPGQSFTLSTDALAALDEELYYYMDTSIYENLFLLPIAAYPPPYPDYTLEEFTHDVTQQNPLCIENTNKGVSLVLYNYLADNTPKVGVRLP